MSHRTATLGLALAGVLALIGVALRLVPATVPVVALEAREPYAPPEPPSGDQQAATLLSFTDIVNGDLLAPDRSPPEERYTPPGMAAEVAVSSGSPTEPAGTPRAPSFRLFGTAVGPQGSVALIDADPAIPGAEVYRVGDRIGGALIEEIRETAVVLVGPAGRYTITLPTSMRRVP